MRFAPKGTKCAATLEFVRNAGAPKTAVARYVFVDAAFLPAERAPGVSEIVHGLPAPVRSRLTWNRRSHAVTTKRGVYRVTVVFQNLLYSLRNFRCQASLSWRRSVAQNVDVSGTVFAWDGPPGTTILIVLKSPPVSAETVLDTAVWGSTSAPRGRGRQTGTDTQYGTERGYRCPPRFRRVRSTYSSRSSVTDSSSLSAR